MDVTQCIMDVTCNGCNMLHVNGCYIIDDVTHVLEVESVCSSGLHLEIILCTPGLHLLL